MPLGIYHAEEYGCTRPDSDCSTWLSSQRKKQFFILIPYCKFEINFNHTKCFNFFKLQLRLKTPLQTTFNSNVLPLPRGNKESWLNPNSNFILCIADLQCLLNHSSARFLLFIDWEELEVRVGVREIGGTWRTRSPLNSQM